MNLEALMCRGRYKDLEALVANRDLTNFRTVTQQVVENPNGLINAGAEITQQILVQRQEAKITQGISEVGLELGKLENQYRIDFEHDPMGGLDKFKNDRQAIFDKYGDNVSPLFRKQWNDQTRQIATRNDAVQQAWGLKQSRINTIDSVNDTMKNNFRQAMNDGQSFGLSDETEIEAFVNYGTAMENIEQFAAKNLGRETAEGMMETYEEDYLKSFISGVAETNPHKGLKLLNDENVKNGFVDPKQYLTFKKGVEARVKRADAALKQKTKASSMSKTNSMLKEIGNMGYAEMQQRFSEFNVSPEAQAFYEDVNGYTSQKKALGAEEKADLKNKFHIFMSEIIGKDDLTNDDIQLLQDSVYAGMRKSALSKNEGYALLNDLLEPVIETQQNRADQFETGKWNPFQNNLGLDTLNQEIAKVSGIDRVEKPTKEQTFNHNKNTNMMYDVYLQSLQQQAKERNVKISGLTSLPYSEEVKVYNKALDTAKKTFIRSKFPSLADRKELPNTVITPISNVNLTEADIDKMSEEELDKFLASQ